MFSIMIFFDRYQNLFVRMAEFCFVFHIQIDWVKGLKPETLGKKIKLTKLIN